MPKSAKTSWSQKGWCNLKKPIKITISTNFNTKNVDAPQEQITQSLLCISTTGSNDSERSDTKLEAPSFPIEYKIFCSTFYAKPYINRFRND